jgi:hypothetical protein
VNIKAQGKIFKGNQISVVDSELPGDSSNIMH